MTDEIQKKEKEVALIANFGAVYLKTFGDSWMKPVRARLSLNPKRHVTLIMNKPTISAEGFLYINKVPSINLVTPLKVIVDGRDQGNPYVERDPDTQAIRSVAVRRMGIGYSPLGNIVVIDKTLFYNVYTYLIQSLQSAMKKDNREKKCAFVGLKEDKPNEGRWVFYVTAPPLGIWANYADPRILEVLEDHTQRQRFGERIAQKIVDRNILRDHPAIATSAPDVVNGKYYVTVYGWRHELGPQQVQDIMAQAVRGRSEFEVKKDVIDVTPEEEQAAKKETEAEDEEEEVKPKPWETEPPDEYWEAQEKKKAEAEKKKPAPAKKQKGKKKPSPPAAPAAPAPADKDTQKFQKQLQSEAPGLFEGEKK